MAAGGRCQRMRGERAIEHVQRRPSPVVEAERDDTRRREEPSCLRLGRNELLGAPGNRRRPPHVGDDAEGVEAVDDTLFDGVVEDAGGPLRVERAVDEVDVAGEKGAQRAAASLSVDVDATPTERRANGCAVEPRADEPAVFVPVESVREKSRGQADALRARAVDRARVVTGIEGT